MYLKLLWESFKFEVFGIAADVMVSGFGYLLVVFEVDGLEPKRRLEHLEVLSSLPVPIQRI